MKIIATIIMAIISLTTLADAMEGYGFRKEIE
jgi:hypothetical protein